MPLPYTEGAFDLLVFADIIEHVARPLDVLVRWLPLLNDNGYVVASLPNIRHFTVSLPLLLLGQWDYQDRGILDESHLRFFTRRSARKLFDDAGLSIG